MINFEGKAEMEHKGVFDIKTNVFKKFISKKRNVFEEPLIAFTEQKDNNVVQCKNLIIS